MAGLEDLVKIEIAKPLPDTGAIKTTYNIEGTVKMLDAIGALPWVYAEVKRKEWWKPEFIEEVGYKRGFPIPITGDFSIKFKPEKEGDYEVTVVATPAPLSLPGVGVFPIVGKTDIMRIRIAERPEVPIERPEVEPVERPEGNVTVQLKNPPAQGDKWQLNVFNASKTHYIFIQDIPMNGIADLTIPDPWDFPLPVILSVFNAINQTIYSINSYHPEFVGYNSKAVIRLPGEWYFNFATEQFESFTEEQ